MSAELKVWFAARGRIVPMVMENIAGNRSVISVIYTTPCYCDALDFAGTTNVVTRHAKTTHPNRKMTNLKVLFYVVHSY